MDHSLRLDKWLWYARFFKSRALATKFCETGRLRINEVVTKKSHQKVFVGDILTFPNSREVRIVRIEKLGVRRGPAAEARTLYKDVLQKKLFKEFKAEKLPKNTYNKTGIRVKGDGRPTKADRRAMEKFRSKLGQ